MVLCWPFVVARERSSAADLNWTDRDSGVDGMLVIELSEPWTTSDTSSWKSLFLATKSVSQFTYTKDHIRQHKAYDWSAYENPSTGTLCNYIFMQTMCYLFMQTLQNEVC